DIFSIVKQGKVTPKRVENPWQPVHDISLLTKARVDFAGEAAGSPPKNWSVAHGNPSGMTVIAEPAGDRKILRARATGEPLIGLFALFKVTDLEVETRIRLPKENRLGAG